MRSQSDPDPMRAGGARVRCPRLLVVLLGLLTLLVFGCQQASRAPSPGQPAGDQAAVQGTSTDAVPPAADSTSPATPESNALASFPTHMSPEQVRTYMASHPGALLLDVRQPEEWNNELGHIDGARQIPLPDLRTRLSEIEAWKSKPVITVCRSGHRSGIAQKELVEAGFEHVANMEGGMLAWRKMEPKP